LSVSKPPKGPPTKEYKENYSGIDWSKKNSQEPKRNGKDGSKKNKAFKCKG